MYEVKHILNVINIISKNACIMGMVGSIESLYKRFYIFQFSLKGIFSVLVCFRKIGFVKEYCRNIIFFLYHHIFTSTSSHYSIIISWKRGLYLKGEFLINKCVNKCSCNFFYWFLIVGFIFSGIILLYLVYVCTCMSVNIFRSEIYVVCVVIA